MKKEITAKDGLEFMKAGFVTMLIILPLAFILDEPMLAWANMFPITIGFMLYSTSQ